MLAVSNAEGTYYRYVKLWLMQRAWRGGRRSMRTAFVVLTYNRSDALLAVLRALAAQCAATTWW